MTNLHRLSVSSELPISFFHEKHPRSEQRLLIFLHGYTDSAASFLRRAYSEVDFDYLAPNGPFPVPVRTDQGFKEAYSWYFEDHSIGKVIIPKSTAIGILKNLVQTLGLEAHRKTLVGFSQGGFLAPQLSLHLTNVEKIIGIGCDYRPELYVGVDQHIQIYGIHGVDDDVVPYQRSHDHFAKLSGGIEFASVAGMGHKMNEEAKMKLREFILS